MSEEKELKAFFQSAGLGDGPVEWLGKNRYTVTTLVRMEDADIQALLKDMEMEVGIRRGEKDGIQNAIRAEKNRQRAFFSGSSPVTASSARLGMMSSIDSMPQSNQEHPSAARIPPPQNTPPSSARPVATSVFPSSPLGPFVFPAFHQYHYPPFPIPSTTAKATTTATTTNATPINSAIPINTAIVPQVLAVATPPVEQRPPPPKKQKTKGDSPLVDLNNAEETHVEKSGRGLQWKDHWVLNLIHIRGQMQEDFGRAPKRGVDLWSKVHLRLLSLCPDLDKDSDGCRKKWKSLFDTYKEQRAEMGRSDNAQIEKFKWFDAVDEYMHDHSPSLSQQAPNTHDDGKSMLLVEEEDGAEGVPPPEDPKGKTSRKRTKHRKLLKILKRVASKSGDMMDKISMLEERKVSMLLAMQESLTSLVNKL